MTESSNCAYRKCGHLAVMHTDRKGSCQWPWCECRQFSDPDRLAAAIARRPAGEATQ